MNWKIKAFIQNSIASLPPAMSYPVYYWIQRKFGGYRNPSPLSGLWAAVEMWKRIQSFDIDPSSKRFFEVGTGRMPTMPIAYWLMGAESTITIDINPYLQDELVQSTMRYFQQNREQIKRLFYPHLDPNRFDRLLSFIDTNKVTSQCVLDLCNITYIAPGDAANTSLEDESIDFHTSYTVFEHIPPDILQGILLEGNRITKTNGLFVHLIDYSDHFSHSDRTISPINFLQYSESEWSRYAGNRFMYMNRLRHDDFIAIFNDSGHRILINQPNMNPNVLEILKKMDSSSIEHFKGNQMIFYRSVMRGL